MLSNDFKLASIIKSAIFSLMDVDKNKVSNCDGATYTPCSNIALKYLPNNSVSEVFKENFLNEFATAG